MYFHAAYSICHFTRIVDLYGMVFEKVLYIDDYYKIPQIVYFITQFGDRLSIWIPINGAFVFILDK